MSATGSECFSGGVSSSDPVVKRFCEGWSRGRSGNDLFKLLDAACFCAAFLFFRRLAIKVS